MRHQEPRCVTERHWKRLAERDWHCCECGWPFQACAETWPELRAITSATSPKCGDNAEPYLSVLREGS